MCPAKPNATDGIYVQGGMSTARDEGALVPGARYCYAVWHVGRDGQVSAPATAWFTQQKYRRATGARH